MRKGIIYGYMLEGKMKYIGQTVNKDDRHKFHMEYSPFNKNCREYDYPFCRAVRKYGAESFVYVVIEDNIDEEFLNEKEIFYIEKYDTYRNGYNQTPGGSIPTTCKYEEDVIEVAIEMLLDNKTFSEIAERTGLSAPHISNINQGKRRRREGLSYPLRANQVGVKGSKLTTKEVDEIILLIKESELSLTAIGALYGISQSAVSGIKSGRRKGSTSETYPLKRQR